MTNVGYIRQFDENDPALSGGGNTKRRIARETAIEDSIILADEPTVNLDQDGIIWVRKKLTEARTVLLISHDRDLLDSICTRVVEVKDGKLVFYTGNYSDYEAASKLKTELLALKHAEYQRAKSQLTEAVYRKEQKVARQKQKKKTELKKNRRCAAGGKPRQRMHDKGKVSLRLWREYPAGEKR